MRTLDSSACSLLLFFVCVSRRMRQRISEPRQVPVGPAPTAPGRRLGHVTLSAPAPVSPVNGEQLSTLRPTLTVQNATSSKQSGTRTYEFQVSDNTGFSLGASLTASFLVSVNQTGVAEGRRRAHSFTVPFDLQPTTRMYWRARVVQGTSTSAWSDAGDVPDEARRVQPAGELYDPLIHSETSAQSPVAHTWITGKGLRLNTETVLCAVSAASRRSRAANSRSKSKGCSERPGSEAEDLLDERHRGDLSFSDMGMSTMYRGAMTAIPPTASRSRRCSAVQKPHRSSRIVGT